MDGLAARALFPVSALARVVVPEDMLGPNWRFIPFGMRVTFLPLEAPMPLGQMLSKFGFMV